MLKRELVISLDGTTEQVSAHRFHELVASLAGDRTNPVGKRTLDNGAVLSWQHVVIDDPAPPVTEAELVATATGPRVSEPRLKAVVRNEQFIQPEGTTLTICVLTLANGFTVVGESAAASPDNFNAEQGQRIARQNALNKVWPLEGYLLRTLLHAQNDGIAVELGARLARTITDDMPSEAIAQQVLTDLWDITGRGAAPTAEG